MSSESVNELHADGIPYEYVSRLISGHLITHTEHNAKRITAANLRIYISLLLRIIILPFKTKI